MLSYYEMDMDTEKYYGTYGSYNPNTARRKAARMTLLLQTADVIWPTAPTGFKKAMCRQLIKQNVMVGAAPELIVSDLKQEEACLGASDYYSNYRGKQKHRLSLMYNLGLYSIHYDHFTEDVRHIICDNKGCFNPYHLIPGTHADNIKDISRSIEDKREVWKGHLQMRETIRYIWAKKYSQFEEM